LPSRGAGGGYAAEIKSIVIHHSQLTNRKHLIFVLGHETPHSLSLRGVPSHRDDLAHDINQIAQGAQRPHDYTPAGARYVEAVRGEEAQAHIGGFNALHSSLAQKKQPVTLEAMYDAEPFRMRDFITQTGSWPFQQYALRPGLTLSQDGTLAHSQGNVDAMKGYYADKMPGTFGENGLLNYRQQAILEGWNQAHGAEIQSIGVDTQSDPRNQPLALVTERQQTGQPFLYHGHDRDYLLDFDQLGVNRHLIRAPLNNQVHTIDPAAEKWRMTEARDQQNLPAPSGQEVLGVVAATLPKSSAVVDRPSALLALGLQPQPQVASSSFLETFKSFFAIEEHPGTQTQARSQAPSQAPTQSPSPASDDSPLLRQATAALKALDPDGGLRDPEALRNVAAAIAVKAQQDGFTSIDQVVRNTKGDGLIAVQGQDIASPEARHTLIDLGQAMHAPADRALQSLQAPTSPSPTVATETPPTPKAHGP
ncbi:MAG: XVIPCD domain-containing protein, partial [Lysobacteraceae bacterium]